MARCRSCGADLNVAVESIAQERAHVIAATLRVYRDMCDSWPIPFFVERFEQMLLAELKRGDAKE